VLWGLFKGKKIQFAYVCFKSGHGFPALDFGFPHWFQQPPCIQLSMALLQAILLGRDTYKPGQRVLVIPIFHCQSTSSSHWSPCSRTSPKDDDQTTQYYDCMPEWKSEQKNLGIIRSRAMPQITSLTHAWCVFLKESRLVLDSAS